MASATRRADAATPGWFNNRGKKTPSPVWAVAGCLLAVLAPPTARATLRSVGAEFQVNTGTAALQTRPAVAMDPSGGLVVVWGNAGSIAGRRYDNAGGAFGGEFLANTSTSGFHTNPAVATDALGGFVIVWESFEPEPSDHVIRARRYDAGGAAVGGEFRVGRDATDRQHHPLIAVDPAGGFLVVWEGHNLTRNVVDFGAIFAQRYDDGGRPIGEELQISGSATRFAGSPALATDSAGNLVVVWEGANDHGAGIFARRYDAAGAAVGGEIQISDPASDAQFAPAVATDAAGGFVVVWQRAVAYTSSVVGRRFDSGGMPIGDVFAVTTDAGYTNVSAKVATFPSGDFAVFWERDDLSQLFFGPGDVAARMYLASGVPESGAFLVNEVVNGDQGSPALAADATGNLVVVWHSLPLDGSERGIFGRRFAASSPTEPTRCACDCDGDHRVTVAELVRGINLLLHGLSGDTCAASDVDGDGAVTIAELITAVDDALSRCRLTVAAAS